MAGFAENKVLLDAGRVLLILSVAESLVATPALPSGFPRRLLGWM